MDTITGIDAHLGVILTSIDHLKQSIRDILTTPIGTRIMRRDYGSRLFELIDRPYDNNLKIELYAATAEALDRWEPRFKLEKVEAHQLEPGHIELQLTGLYRPQGKTTVVTINL